MPREPKQNVEDHVDRNEDDPANGEAAVSRLGDYYYDDAHGYEDYDPDRETEEDELEN